MDYKSTKYENWEKYTEFNTMFINKYKNLFSCCFKPKYAIWLLGYIDDHNTYGIVIDDLTIDDLEINHTTHRLINNNWEKYGEWDVEQYKIKNG